MPAASMDSVVEAPSQQYPTCTVLPSSSGSSPSCHHGAPAHAPDSGRLIGRFGGGTCGGTCGPGCGDARVCLEQRDYEVIPTLPCLVQRAVAKLHQTDPGLVAWQHSAAHAAHATYTGLASLGINPRGRKEEGDYRGVTHGSRQMQRGLAILWGRGGRAFDWVR